MIDKLQAYLTEHPEYFGVLFVVFGVVLLVAAIRGSKWLFEKDVSGVTYSLKKIDGWINMFGKKAARVYVGISGVVVIIAGVAWFLIYAFYY